jgi:enterochelin esterase-like enzyme/dienelactone hydrolase
MKMPAVLVRSKSRLLMPCFAALSATTSVVAQQAAPNEGRFQAGPQLRVERDIEFASPGGRSLKLDLYRMDPSAGPSPVVVWIHGAAGPLSSRVATPAVGLVAPGTYAVVSIDYRVGPGTTRTMQLADVKAAIRWLRRNGGAYNLDTGHIGVFGYDVGGQLAALAGTTGDVAALEGDEGNADQSSRVQAVVDVAGPTSGDLNPVSHVTPAAAPTLIIHGSADDRVPTPQSQSLISALKVAGVNSTLDMPFGVSHELGDLLSTVAMQSIGTFFGQYLMGAKVVAGLSSFVATPSDAYIDPIGLDLGGTKYELYPTPVRGPDTYASYRIYLPPDYATNRTRRYPVIYFVHGRSVDSKRPITSGYVARADAAIRSGVMPPAIIVIVQGLNTGWYLDAQDGRHPMESVIIKNLIPFVDASYRTIPTREGRAVEGHSMGGFGALHLGFKYPKVFGAVTANSPALIKNVTDGVGSQAFWDAQSPEALARANTDKIRRQSIRIICGDKDGLFAGAQAMDSLLTGLNVAHEFRPVPGSPHNHDQLLQYEAFDTMAFYGTVFRGLKGTGKTH